MAFESVEKLDSLIEEYFSFFEEGGKYSGRPITFSGLALHLDICTKTLMNYGKREEFFPSIRRARQAVENQYEMNLHYNNSTGSIFALKNFGWKDKQEVDHGGQIDNPIQIVKNILADIDGDTSDLPSKTD